MEGRSSWCQPVRLKKDARPAQVVIVDEIGSSREVEAAKSIAHRGVVLVGGRRACTAIHMWVGAAQRPARGVRAPASRATPPLHPPPQVGTAHGRSLAALLKNGELNGLVGGVHQVTLGDEEARRSNNGCAPVWPAVFEGCQHRQEKHPDCVSALC
jgi:hypothetical protein